jgi:hypothetical protein
VLHRASTAEHDGGGMDAIERSIEQARGGGHGMDHGTRGRMEGAFGADFSGVRIHTDARADGLSRALSARAFATGQDVFFRRGEYNPGTSSGRELLALTHVVQQSSGNVSRAPSSGKSKAEVSPGVQQIRRYRETAAVPSMGSGLAPSTVTIDFLRGEVRSVSESGPASGPIILPFVGRIETLTLPENVTGGTVLLHFYETAEINNLLLNDLQWGVWDGTVPFTVNGDQVSFGAAITTSDVHGSGATLTVSPGSGVTPGGGYVSFSVTIASSGSVTTGGSVGVGPISGSAPVSGTANLAGGITRTFVVNLRTTPPQPIPGPDASFQVGSDRLDEGQEGIIANWFEGLSGTAKDMVRNGRRSISVTGYASTTGPRGKNRNLSERRARVVERILRGHVGSNANLNIFFVGEDNATTPDQTETPRWRRATMVVQAPTRTLPGVPTP